MIKRLLPLIAFVLALLTPLPSFAQTCPGKFPNPLTDICWSCMFPIRIFNANVLSMGQEDALTRDSSLLCSCLDKGGSTVLAFQWNSGSNRALQRSSTSLIATRCLAVCSWTSLFEA